MPRSKRSCKAKREHITTMEQAKPQMASQPQIDNSQATSSGGRNIETVQHSETFQHSETIIKQHMHPCKKPKHPQNIQTKYRTSKHPQSAQRGHFVGNVNPVSKNKNKANMMATQRASYKTKMKNPKYNWYNPLIPKLREIFDRLHPLCKIAKWPKPIQSLLMSHIKIDSQCWNTLFYSLVKDSKIKGYQMSTYATQTFNYLRKQIWNDDLWTLLLEKLSAFFKVDSLYQSIIHVVLQIAKEERFKLEYRSAYIASLISENAWYRLCNAILPLLVKDDQRCKIILLCLAVAGMERARILTFLTLNDFKIDHGNEKGQPTQLFLMTEERWENLNKVVEELNHKRRLRMQSNAGDIQNSETTNVVDSQNEIKDIDIEVVIPNVEVEKVNERSGDADIQYTEKQASTSYFHENHIKKESSSEVNASFTIEKEQVNLIVKQEPNAEIFATPMPEYLLKQIGESGLSLSDGPDNNIIKQEPNDSIKIEDCEVSLKGESQVVSSAIFPDTLLVKNDEAFQDPCPTSLDQEKEKENKQKDVEELSLDKLILEFSMKQLNNVDHIDISDDDDCVINEDNKLEVAQLLDMYRDIVSKQPPSTQPSRLVVNPLAKQDTVQSDVKFSTQNDVKKEDIFAVPTFIERNPSTSSSTKSNRINVQMSSHKHFNQIKRNRSKTNAGVQKLFDQLRNESQASSSTTENTVINLDDTVTPVKRKRSLTPKKGNFKKKRYFQKEMPDKCRPVIPFKTEANGAVTPKKPSLIHCSTPLINKNNNELEFIPLISNKAEDNGNASQDFNEKIADLTKQINRDSYLTIDLTNESLNCSSISKTQNTVIDLDNSLDNTDCAIVSNTNLSLSGESDVTVLNMSQSKKNMQVRKFVKGISKLDAAEKGRLLELITQNIFSGCSVLDKKADSLHNDPRETATRATETAEDTYIKEVILGQAGSRNSIGSNIYNPERDGRHRRGLRMVIIDGSNVAMQHGRGREFSVKGLKICIDYFLNRGHVVKAFVPRFRCKFGKSSDPRLLDHLEQVGLVVYTPSREIQGRFIASYDDRYIVQCAAEFDGVIVSGDNYRDLLMENPRWRSVIENRLLQFTWVQDMIMFPRDPLGRNGPTLEQFLTHPEPRN